MGLQQVAFILLGWCLGLLAPAIQERIRRTYKRKELTIAIETELHELQYKMALVSFRLTHYSGLMSDAYLNWLEPFVRDYNGPNPTSGVLDALREHRKLPEQARCRRLTQMRNPNSSVGMVEYFLPFLTAHIAEVSLYPIPFQAAVIRIKDQLDMFNQRVVNQQKSLDKTFDASLEGKNREAVLSNIDAGYADLASQARFIADAVARLPNSLLRRGPSFKR